MDEISRIKKAYAERDRKGKDQLYACFKPAALFMKHQREKAIINTLKRFGATDLSDKRVLDMGCGEGGVLREFMKYGGEPEHFYGIDLLPDKIDRAKKISPNMNFKCGNAETLPYQDNFFDIVLAFTVFTSIFDERLKSNISQEMLRVLAPGGGILWYDFNVNNPWNPDVRGIKGREIFGLFQGCRINLQRVTLAPPLTRGLAPYSWLACYLLEKIPFLCTHYLGWIRKA